MSLSDSQTSALLEASIEWCTSPVAPREGAAQAIKVLPLLARKSPRLFAATLTPVRLANVLRAEPVVSLALLVLLRGTLEATASAFEGPLRETTLVQCHGIVRLALQRWLRSNAFSTASTRVAVSDLIRQFPSLLDTDDDATLIIESLVCWTSTLPHAQFAQGRVYSAALSALLGHRVSLGSASSFVQQVLKTMFECKCAPESTPVSAALAFVAAVVTPDSHVLTQQDASQLASAAFRAVPDDTLLRCLRRMCTWLSVSSAGSTWLPVLLDTLAADGRHGTLYTLAISSSAFVLLPLVSLSVDSCSPEVLACMSVTCAVYGRLVAGHRPSAEPFLASVPTLNRAIRNLAAQQLVLRTRLGTAASSLDAAHRILGDTLHELARLVRVLTQRHSGHPELYPALLEALQTACMPTQALSEEALQLDRKLVDALEWNVSHSTSAQQALLDATVSMAACTHSEILSARAGVGIGTHPAAAPGLANLGNTCFGNSILQALFHATPLLARRLLSLTTTSTTHEHLQPVICSVRRLFAFLAASHRAVVSPDWVFRSAVPAWFDRGAQQDCSEYMRFLLDRMSEEELASTRGGEEKDTLRTGEEDECVDSAPLTSMFDGEWTYVCRCETCASESRVSEGFRDITVPIQCEEQTASTSVQSLLDATLVPETLDGANAYACVQCGSPQPAKRIPTVSRTPDCLVLTLGRFAYSPTSQRTSKITDSVSLSRSLELYGRTYKLAAIVVHSGDSLHHGHYYSYVCNGSDGNDNAWLLCNDDRVSPSSYAAVERACTAFPRDSPYVLVYVAPGSREAPLTLADIADPVLRAQVNADNTTALLEQRTRTAPVTRTPSHNTLASQLHRKDFDDDPGNGAFGSDLWGGGRSVF